MIKDLRCFAEDWWCTGQDWRGHWAGLVMQGQDWQCSRLDWWCFGCNMSKYTVWEMYVRSDIDPNVQANALRC